MRKIIIGNTGIGKTRLYVGPAIKNYEGKVIWLNTTDAIDYLKLSDCVKSYEPKELKEVNDFDKIEIIINVMSDEREDYMKIILDFLYKHIDEKVLMVFDEATYTLNKYLPDILKNINGSDKLIILQSYKQLEVLVDQYRYDSREDYNLQEVLSKWEVLDLNALN